MDYTIRPITEDEYEAFVRQFKQAFAGDYEAEEAKLERDLIELPRTLAAFDDADGLVGTAVAYRRDMAVPGGVLACGHVSLVSVAATHRRRGILRAMMTRLLTDLRTAGEPIAALWASEDAIYGRFGYGPATLNVEYEADNRELSVPALTGPGRLREAAFTGLQETLAAVYEKVWRDRPGHSGRGTALWRAWQADLDSWRGGASKLRAVLHEVDGEVDGYALFRMRKAGDATGPKFVVEVQEIVAVDLPAYRQLWRYLFSIDLSRTVKYPYAAVDEPLRYLVTEARRLGERVGNGIWVRVLDLPAALAARRYAAPVDVVLEVTDELLPDNAGRWRLRVDGGTGSCERTDDPAELELSAAELGAAYLGGTSLASLAAAGRVRELTPGALAPTSAAFGWHKTPVSIEVF